MKKALGFTLVEISVVLVVIGIIMGMAVKGRDLVETSRLRKEIRKLDKFASVAAVSYSVERILPADLSTQALKEGLLTKDDLEVNSYFNNTDVCEEKGCVWRFIRAVTIYAMYDNTSYYRSPDSSHAEKGDVLLAVADAKDNLSGYSYANSFVCKIEEYLDDKRFNGGMGAFFDNDSGVNAANTYYAGVCSPSKNLLSGASIPYGYKVF
jgi:prepilin-type N-terminal cleavage/methylation domain-containing protein